MPLPDLAPSVASRWVQIDRIRLTEDAPADGHVDFRLVGDIHVPAAKKIISGSEARAYLVDGQGQIRLPTYDDTIRPADWSILVKKSWAPEPYAVRVPAGSGPINLAELPEIQGTMSASQVWALTGVGLITTTGAYGEGAAGSVTISAGIATFRLRLPQGAPGLGNAAVEQQSNGLYAIIPKTSKTAQDWAADALGFYLLPGPPTAETIRNGLPVYFMGGAA